MKRVNYLGKSTIVLLDKGILGGAGSPIAFSVETRALMWNQRPHYRIAREFSLTLGRRNFAVSVLMVKGDSCRCAVCSARRILPERKRPEAFQPYEFSGCSRDKEKV